jgi:hypothetical protein
MKKLLITLVGSLTLGAALPVFAGPDWQVIDKARRDKQAVTDTTRVSSSGTSAATGDCRAEPLVLALDHGPRAQTTPQQNQLRKERYEAQVKACAGTTK